MKAILRVWKGFEITVDHVDADDKFQVMVETTDGYRKMEFRFVRLEHDMPVYAISGVEAVEVVKAVA